MGYYSFYKIIKDIIRTIFNKKVLYIFLLVVFILSLFSYLSKSYGYNVDLDFDNNTYTLNLPDWVEDNNIYYAVFISRNRSNPDVFHAEIIFSDTDNLTISSTTGNFNITGTGFLDWNTTRNSSGQTYSDFINYLNNNLASFTYENYTQRKKTYASLKQRYYFFDGGSTMQILNQYSSINFMANNDSIYFPANSIVPPKLLTPIQNLETLTFDYLSVEGNSYSTQDFDILLYDLNYGSDTTDGLYPQKIITLNKDSYYYNDSVSTSKNYVYWIPIDEIGLNLIPNGKYAIKFAIRNYDVYQGGGGFRESARFIYNYIGESTVFTISSDVSDSKIDSLNNAIKKDEEKERHDETMGGLNNIDNSINNMNNFFNDPNVDNTTNEDISNSFDYDKSNQQLEGSYNGFMSRFMALLAGLYDYDLNTVDTVEIPLPYSTKKIVLYSNIISSHIGDPLKSLIIAFWMYLFYFYGYKFLSYMLVQIQEGKILDSSNSDDTVGTLPTSLL